MPSYGIGQTPPKVIREQGFPFLTEAVPEARVLVLTVFCLDEYVHEGLPAGASGFLLKDGSRCLG